MDTMAFLLGIRVSGIKSIEKTIKIDFYGKSVNKHFNPQKYKVKGIYGENGAGKSAIITAIEIAKELIFNENYLRDPQKILLLKELINKKTEKLTVSFEFLTNIETLLIYEYEITLLLEDGDIIVESEALRYKENNSNNKQRIVFECERGEFINLIISEEMRQIVIDRSRNLLLKQSALYSCFSILGKDERLSIPSNILYPIIFFLMLNTHFDKEDKHKDYYHKRKIESLKNMNISAEKMIEEYLNGIATDEGNIPISIFEQYQKNVKRLERFVKLFKPDLKKIDIERKENNGFYKCELLMDYGDYRVNKEFESTGIKKIMDLYNMFSIASTGGIVFIDELDSNINDIYLCKIIEYFKYFGKK